MKKLLLCLALALPVTAQAGSTMERIIKDGIIRCGYVTYEPGMHKDTATGQLSGYDYDATQAVADRLDIKVTYPVETGWGTFTADLKSKKFDVLCGGSWVNPKIGKFVLFSRPVRFEPIYLVARADDKRFDKDLSVVNDEKIKIVALDGDNPVFIAKTDFPKAKIVELPDMTDFSQTLVNVEAGKADVTIVDRYTFGTYNDHNPGKLKIVQPNHPIRIYPTSFAFLPEDYQLRDAVNAALDELILDGTISRLNKKYEKYPGVYLDAEVPVKK